MQRNCDVCQNHYEAKRPNSKFCSDTCRKRAQRAPEIVTAPLVAVDFNPASAGALYAATLRELEACEQVESSLGQTALLLARRLDDTPMDTGSSVAALVREHRATLQEAVERGTIAADPLDQLSIRRRERLAHA